GCLGEGGCLDDAEAGCGCANRPILHPALADRLYSARERTARIHKRLPQRPVPFGHLGHARGALGFVFRHRSVNEQYVLHGFSLSAGTGGCRSAGAAPGSGCKPSAVSMYAPAASPPVAMLTKALPAISGVTGFPSCRRYSSSLTPVRAAYATVAARPRSVKGVSLGSTALTMICRSPRRASWAALSAMKRWVALAPAYPPLNGDPMIAAPLLITMIRLPRRSGRRSASRSQ